MDLSEKTPFPEIPFLSEADVREEGKEGKSAINPNKSENLGKVDPRDNL